MKKIIIFDVDDTIIDSGREFAKNVIKIGKILGLESPGWREIAKLNGLPDRKIIETLWPDLEYKLFQDEYYKLRPSFYKPLPGALEVIRRFKKNGYILGILTSRAHWSLEERFLQIKLPINDFSFLTTTSHSKYRKPDPRVFDLIKKEFKKEGLNKDDAIYIGDSMYDYQASKGAGIDFIAVTNGAYGREDFVSSGLDSKYIIKSLLELPGLLEKE